MNPDSPLLTPRFLRSATAVVGMSMLVVAGWAVWPDGVATLAAVSTTPANAAARPSDEPRFADAVIANVITKRLQGKRAETRQPKTQPPAVRLSPAPAKPKPLDRLGIRLVGTVLEPGRPSVAIAVANDGSIVFCAEGETVAAREGDYRITRIDEEHVEGECNGERYRVTLGSPPRTIDANEEGVDPIQESEPPFVPNPQAMERGPAAAVSPPIEDEVTPDTEEDWPDDLESELDFLNGN